MDHQEMPGVDAPWYAYHSFHKRHPINSLPRYWEYSKLNHGYTDPFPGLELRKVNMDKYNESKLFNEKRSLKYYAIRGKMPSVKEDPNMHAAAHLYASDRNSLFVMYMPIFLFLQLKADR